MNLWTFSGKDINMIKFRKVFINLSVVGVYLFIFSWGTHSSRYLEGINEFCHWNRPRFRNKRQLKAEFVSRRELEHPVSRQVSRTTLGLYVQEWDPGVLSEAEAMENLCVAKLLQEQLHLSTPCAWLTPESQNWIYMHTADHAPLYRLSFKYFLSMLILFLKSHKLLTYI